MGQPCSPFGPALLSFFPGFCLGRKIGPTGTSGHPFGPGAVLFWAAAGAIVMMVLFWNHLLFFCTQLHTSFHLAKFCLMWTVVGLDAERGGSDVGSRFIPSADWCWYGRERPASCLRPRSATFPLLHVSPLPLTSRFTVEF